MSKSKDKEAKPESRKRKADDKTALTEDKATKKARKEAKKAAKKEAKAAPASSNVTASLFDVSGRSTLDPTLSSLFSNPADVVINPSLQTRHKSSSKPKHVEEETETDGGSGQSEDEVDDEVLSELDSDEMDALDVDDEDEAAAVEAIEELDDITEQTNRRRKRKDEHDDLEVKYLDKLSKDAAKLEKLSKTASISQEGIEAEIADEDAGDSDDDEAIIASPPLQHESIAPKGSEDFEKAQRTVFLGNVSTTAITSKSALKALNAHLVSFFPSLPEANSSDPPRSVESIRFRSTPFSSGIPKRASFARKDVMEATSHSTNAYAVYSSSSLAREACKHLNGSIVLDRHLRVDSVAHPAKQDHKRCVFIGNLGFVDDESFIDAANAEAGREQRKGKKVPSDVEEGLWRTFSLCGKVESVRIVRDPKTQVGKGFGYVQFADENAVEAALLNNDKKFPPMLPRKLRVTRAKPVKRNVAAAKRAAAEQQERRAQGKYVKKLTPQEQSQMGRAGKLLGKNAAAHMRRSGSGAGGIQVPESFVFEGHRAKAGSKPGLKQKKGGKKALPTKNSKKRGAAWKEKRAKAQ